MMQDGKALQAGTSHYLGTHFSHAQNIRYQTEQGDLAYAHDDQLGRFHTAGGRRSDDAW